MRTSVISRFVATSAVAVTLGIGLPLLTGGTSAWACGDEPDTTVAAPAAPVAGGQEVGGTGTADLPVEHKGELSVSLLKAPTAVTAGGVSEEITVDITNNTDGAYTTVRPSFAMFNPHGGLRIPDLKVEWWNRGAWRPLALRHSCDPVVWVRDEAMPTFGLAKGETAHMKYRFGVTAGLPKDVDLVNVDVSAGAEDFKIGAGRNFDVKIDRPTATPTGTPTTAAPTVPAPAKPTTVPAADTTTAPATTPADTTPEQQELASTGPSKATAFLLWSALASLALGGGVLYGVRRVAKR